jgi:serine/threonine protein kinase
MGEVYLAQDTKLERTVALKVLLKKDDDAQTTRRFMQEAKVASCLSHPNICVIYEVGKTETDERNFIAMEHIEGRLLELHLQQLPEH